MRRGLVIGKFMPLHKGHIGLVRFAAAHCDELILSMSYKPTDPIPGPLRFEWVKQEFRIYPKVKPEITLDDFDDEHLPWKERIPRWAAFLKKRFPPVDLIFSSEAYGPLLAESLGIPNLSFDPDRQDFPVSGSMIREQPFQYWDFISIPAQSYFVKKICLYGPESTGKSTLALKMAQQYQTQFVPEVAKEIISTNNFTAEDIIHIGKAQTQRVLEKLKVANRILFCDTDVITTQIYCHHYLHMIPPVLFELEKTIQYDQYFFCDIDVPWVADGLRDLGNRRDEMRAVFWNELTKRKIVPMVLSGTHAQRQETLEDYLEGIGIPNPNQ